MNLPNDNSFETPQEAELFGQFVLFRAQGFQGAAGDFNIGAVLSDGDVFIRGIRARCERLAARMRLNPGAAAVAAANRGAMHQQPGS